MHPASCILRGGAEQLMEETEWSLHEAIIDSTAVSIFQLFTPSLIIRSEILRQACYGKNFILNLLRRAVQNDSAFAGGGAIDMELSK